MFSVQILFYGNHLHLAQRCLESIMHVADVQMIHEFRVGFNDVCDETRRYVCGRLAESGIPSLVYEPERNVMKYPLMRRMFHDPDRPIHPSWIMWFDDDSCLSTRDANWWRLVAVTLENFQADMLGHIWVKRIEDNQHLGIQAQSWYTGKTVGPKYKMKFATGGWWVAKRDMILKHNYPWPALHHNGGDTTLGEMIRQQGYRLQNFDQFLWINADERGRHSKAARRGVQTKPVWHDFHPDFPIPDLSHHDFDIKVYDPKESNP
jgi:hypothetical protein